MLGELRIARRTQLVLIGEHAAQMDQPATQEGDEQRPRRRHGPSWTASPAATSTGAAAVGSVWPG